MNGKLEFVHQSGGMGKHGLSAGLLSFAVCLGALVSAPVMRADDAAPVARAVRLSSVDGHVQLSKDGQTLAESAVANTPLFQGTDLITADDGRAEIQFEDGSVARISPNSSLTLTVLRGAGANAEAVITLDGGLGYFELQGAGQAGIIKVKFGDSEVTTSGFSVMRINMDTPPGELAVFSGNAHLERGSAVTVDLHGGESLALSGSDPTHYTLNESIEPDSWDSWNSDRDQVLTSEAADKTGATKDYSNSSNPAWNDLDANGNWYDVPGQGNIWSPYEASDPGWDPYGNGNWGFSPGYGYTWISGNSWGYLPYQCGMWNWYESFGWGWAPGIGGCNPWWGGGGYFGPNIGIGYGGYRPPMRPHPPRRPLGGGMLIAVNRRPAGPNVSLPARDRYAVATINGHTVMPMHPLSSRPQYDHSVAGIGSHAVPGPGGRVIGGQARPGGSTFGNSRPSSSAGGRNSSSSQRSYSAPASHASAPSGGGGGGGASHGGGGGGSHH